MIQNYIPTIQEICYLAGIIDGEGSITISSSPGKEGRSRCYQAFIGVSNTEKPLIDWLHAKFGGCVREYSPKQTPKNSRKKVFFWQISGDNLDRVLDFIEPYTVIKKEQVEIIKLMRTTYGFHRRGTKGRFGHGWGRLSQEDINLRESCHKKLKSLHNRSYN